MTNRWVTWCSMISICRLIVASSNYERVSGFNHPFEDAIDNTTSIDPNETTKSSSTAISIGDLAPTSNVRTLNAYTQHKVRAQSVTQELYGITDLSDEDTKATFQEIYDEYVESYFTLRVDPNLLLHSEIKVTNVLMPPAANRYLRNLDVSFAPSDATYEGSSVIVTFDQQLSYYFPKDGGSLALETLVTIPFLTESGRSEFILNLKDSGDDILQNIIGVSGVNIPSQSPETEPLSPPTQRPIELVSEPQPSQPTNSPPNNRMSKPPTALSTGQPISAPVQTAPPSAVPVPPPTAISNSPQSNTTNSRGISGLLIIACLMAVLFIIFYINMKYCMGEYVD